MEGSPARLQEILDELNITSLDDSDLEAGALDGFSDAGSGISAGMGTSVGVGHAGPGASLGEESSADSVLSADVHDALASDGAVGELAAAEELERRLRLGAFPVPGGRLAQRPVSGVVTIEHVEQVQQQLERVQLDLQRSIEDSQLRREIDRSRSTDARAAPRVQGQNDNISAGAPASAAFRMQMSDLAISEAQYQCLRQTPEDQLNVREWVQLRFHEARASHTAEAERLRLEVEALRENAYAAQTRAERAERNLQRREAAVSDLTQELERQQQHAKTRETQLTNELAKREKSLASVAEKEQRYDAVSAEAERLRNEVNSLLQALSTESSASQKLTKDHADSIERLLQLENEHKLLRKDAESHERRARLLETNLAHRDDEVAELRAKVEALRDKKKELARRAAAEQSDLAHDTRERVEAEIRRLRERADADLEAVRANLTALHTKEVQMMRERIEVGETRIAELQRRLEDEEHAHQALQLSSSRIKAELQNEITELTGALKLRAFEVERAALTQEEVSRERQQAIVENDQLKQQVEVLKKEYYTLEVQHREGRAAERAELLSLREQLRSYAEVERELDSAIRACAEGPGTALAADGTGAPRNVDEALLLGTTLASAPTSAQRRIQQSLLLAQELQRRGVELAKLRASESESRSEIERLTSELEVTRKELQYSSEPQAYLLDTLRQREREMVELRRQIRAHTVELDRSRDQLESAVNGRLAVEEDLRRLLAQRHHLESLQTVLAGSGESVAPAPQVRRDGVFLQPAEQRGRAPSQQGTARQAPAPAASGACRGEQAATEAGPRAAPAWFQRLKVRQDATLAAAGNDVEKTPLPRLQRCSAAAPSPRCRCRRRPRRGAALGASGLTLRCLRPRCPLWCRVVR
eukprot:TRINITY_DN2927_c0_g1_i1.p1 TRINITY_DN2927_c0_g1~~TRINITY_DN2927_c0_g1_i1.p1  ORF type:complete len:880 (+),score=144.76 TRINITY_DN2927_c0_g1_i1:89-2728(+)